jgi:hypothetical protein
MFIAKRKYGFREYVEKKAIKSWRKKEKKKETCDTGRREKETEGKNSEQREGK